MGLLAQFSYLQILDLLTTVVFLSLGVREGNPIVNLVLRNSSNPLEALLLVKIVAFAIAFYCWKAGRHSLLIRANWFFAALVVWNVLALGVSTGQFSKGL